MALRMRSGKWHYRFKYQGRAYSGRTGLAATEPNRTAAVKKEMEHRRALEEGRNPIRIIVREFSSAVEEFLDWYKGEHAKHPSSYLRMRTSMTSWKAHLGTKPVSMIGPGVCERYKTWRRGQGIKEVTLRHDLLNLSAFMQYAMTQSWAQVNPLRLGVVKIPSDRDASRIHVVTAAEEKAYFAAAQGDVHDLGRLILNQGARPGELLSLAKQDVDLDRRTLYIVSGKSKAARRKLHLTDESARVLGRRMAGASKWVFPSPTRPGRHLLSLNTAHEGALKRIHDAACAKEQQARAAKRAGAPAVLGCDDWRGCPYTLPILIYDFRHTFATRMAEKGCDLATLAAILGHSSIRMVQKYVHVTDGHQREVMQAYSAAVETERMKQEAREQVQ